MVKSRKAGGRLAVARQARLRAYAADLGHITVPCPTLPDSEMRYGDYREVHAEGPTSLGGGPPRVQFYLTLIGASEALMTWMHPTYCSSDEP